MKKALSIAYLDGPRIERGLSAGIQHVFQRRDYINRINVFPVPDGDTGTNMAFTFKAILEALSRQPSAAAGKVMASVSAAALDGARGNSGAIMAQYFQGFSEAVAGQRLITARQLAVASHRGATQAWTAMSEPVAGTLPSVLEAFAEAMNEDVKAGVRDIRKLLKNGLKRAQEALDNTPNQLAVLKQAGVVDAGGQGFVDLLEGIWAFTDRGELDAVTENLDELANAVLDAESVIGEHRFCTECVIEGSDLNRQAIMQAVAALDGSSLVVAGSPQRARVHVHVNNPAEVYLACEAFGEIRQQKADDMKRQHGLLNQPGRVAIVVDSGADLPLSEIERLAIHVVPVRLSFGDREYLDGVSLKPAEFYRMLDEEDEVPQTSQPPAGDFRRIFTLLTSHDYDVMNVALSSQLSGTLQAARSAAQRVREGDIRVFDTLNASCGQGLLAIAAAEAAARGLDVDEIESLLMELAPQTLTMALPQHLDSAVRGGRVPAWVQRLSKLLHVQPILKSKNGKLGLGGMISTRIAGPQSLARRMLGAMEQGTIYRVLVAHVDNPEGARSVRRHVLEGHAHIHSCLISDAGPAVGVHLGRGGLIAGFMPQAEVLAS